MSPGTDCPLCGDPVRVDLDTCLPCSGFNADGLLFADPRTTDEANSITSRLRSFVAGEADPQALALAGSGHRAIAGVRLDAGPSLTAAFEGSGIPVRVARSRALARTPRGVIMVVGVMALSGLAAGMVAAPSYLLFTPLMVGMLMLLTQIRLRTPVVPPRTGLTLVGSSEAARSVSAQLALLEPGPARLHLARIASLARLLEKPVADTEDPSSMDTLRELVQSAAPVAAELDRLGQIRRVLDQGETAGDPAHRRATAEIEQAMGRLDDALTQAAEVLQRAGRADSEALEDAAELPRLARRIESHLEAWDEALQTVDRLLHSA